MENNLDIMTRLDYLVSGIDTVWVLLAAILIFMMQMGFASVEAGFTRSKNTANILMNLTNIVFNFFLIYATRPVRFCGLTVTVPGAGLGVVGAAIGTAVGGKKIIKKVGMEMVRLDKYQGFAASVSATASLLIATLTGLPVSTTHTKTAAIMGAGAAKDPKSVNWGVAKEMVLTWVFTFPGCGIIGYLLAKLFLVMF